MKGPLLLTVLIFCLLMGCGQKEEQISFSRDIRPLLNEKCLSCHGGVKKNGGLGLRFRDEALMMAESGQAAILPGDGARSELILRLRETDPDIRMPLEQDPLTEAEVQALAQRN